MITAIVAAVSALAGIFLSQLIDWLRESKRQQEQYRLQLYSRRLQAHQEGYAWVFRIESAFVAYHNSAEHYDAGDLQGDAAGERYELARRVFEDSQLAREWWNTNCLYLDKESRGMLFTLIKGAYGYASSVPSQGADERRRWSRSLSNDVRNALKAIEMGIGAKHLPETLEKRIDEKAEQSPR